MPTPPDSSPAAVQNSILVRLSCEAADELPERIDAVVRLHASMNAVVLSVESLGSRILTTLDVLCPRPGEITDFIYQLTRLGRVRVITHAERDDTETT